MGGHHRALHRLHVAAGVGDFGGRYVMAQWPDLIDVIACDAMGVNEYPLKINGTHVLLLENWNEPLCKVTMRDGLIFYMKPESNPTVAKLEPIKDVKEPLPNLKPQGRQDKP